MRKDNRGFTTIEILVMTVILILLLVATIMLIIGDDEERSAKYYVIDASSFTEDIENRIVNDDEILRPKKNTCSVFRISFIDSETQYDSDRSFVVASGNTDKKTNYYVRLVEKVDDEVYRGIDLQNIDDIAGNDDSERFVTKISNEKAIDVEQYVGNLRGLVKELRNYGISCDGIILYTSIDKASVSYNVE